MEIKITEKKSQNVLFSIFYFLFSRKKGFTLIEIAVVMGIVVLLSVVGLGSLFNRRSRVDLDNTTRQIVALLREAQSRSAAQENGTIWGVHFDNAATTTFYALFKTSYNASNTVGSYPLSTVVRFSTASIPSGRTLDITFAQISGNPSTSTPLTLELFSGSRSGGSVIATSTITPNASSGLIQF